jgi:endonuclease/exonuclease/phosphatase family metal-dependent hydrolase
LLLFGPRWVLAVPLPVLAPVAAFLRPWLLLPLVPAAVLLAPITGLRWSPSQGSPSDNGATLRVGSLNAGGGTQTGAVAALIGRLEVDILALQEARELPAGLPDGWHVARHGSLVLVSRYPIVDTELLTSPETQRWYTTGMRYTVLTPCGKLSFFNLHLETPREGLEALLSGGRRGIPMMKANTKARELESRLASAWVSATPGLVLIAGDFNMPVESTIYRQYWSQYSNAFSVAGSGWGFTKRTRWLAARIDHVLAAPHQWRILACSVEEAVGGDHRPVIADLTLANSDKEIR